MHGWLWWRLMLLWLGIKEKEFSQFLTYSHCWKKNPSSFPSFFLFPRVSAGQESLRVWLQDQAVCHCHVTLYIINRYCWTSLGDRALILEVWVKGREARALMKLVVFYKVGAKLLVLVAQLCPTLCNTMGCSPPASSVHGIFQVRILE